ncbi:hypothetical protein HZH66_000008 [Vespula vulgaris]|uniref:Uncharacterized protein n=1 Tax=Vespula vulgaris TaxID=7454 RepID=A0A834KQR5_VESVU|nr:hypothetical protein HZH66_000008 [Vespula vulgaris]
MRGKTLKLVTAWVFGSARLSPTEDYALIFVISKYRHNRSCLEMSETDSVDGGAICKRGFIHLQFAEKSEALEAKKHPERELAIMGKLKTKPILTVSYPYE